MRAALCAWPVTLGPWGVLGGPWGHGLSWGDPGAMGLLLRPAGCGDGSSWHRVALAGCHPPAEHSVLSLSWVAVLRGVALLCLSSSLQRGLSLELVLPQQQVLIVLGQGCD